MGCSALATCVCGYQSPLLKIGGGMRDYDRRCDFPAFCPEGPHLVTVNMVDKPRRCPDGHEPEPVPYDDEALVGSVGDHVVAEWSIEDRELQLTDGSYLCPVCLNHTLTFADGWTDWD